MHDTDEYLFESNESLGNSLTANDEKVHSLTLQVFRWKLRDTLNETRMLIESKRLGVFFVF